MPRFEHRLFGYRIIKGESGKEGRLASHLIRLGISAKMCEGGGFIISARDFKRFRSYAGGRIRYTVTDEHGLPSLIKRNLIHFPTVLAVLAGLLINILLSLLVWDVRISGNDKVSREQIVAALEQAGFGVGQVWSLTDKEAVEVETLNILDELSWISINRKGTVAYVEVKEAEEGKLPPGGYECSNIVASTDCVIEEIDVRHGRAMVKAGDVVSRGDILISGVIDTEAGTFFTRAEGTVKAQVVKVVSASASKEEHFTEKSLTRACEINLKLFGVSINIYKNYGNLPKDYAIIENEEVCVIADEHKLPLSVVTKYIEEPCRVIHTNQLSELPALAGERLMREITESARGADLVKLKTTGGYSGSGYNMKATLILSVNVGKEIEVSIKD